MNYNDLAALYRSPNDEFDLTQSTFIYDLDIIERCGEYVVQRGEEMRMDLVCESIYKTKKIEVIDILCNINNIDNPINIKEGELILHPQKNDINKLLFNDNDNNSLEQAALDSQSVSKKNRQDPNRKQYIDNKGLPPTQLSNRIRPITIDNVDKLSVGDGLFK